MRVDAEQDSNFAVFLDGVDISDICTAANDEEGWADVLLRDRMGRIRATFDPAPLKKRVTGQVVIKPTARITMGPFTVPACDSQSFIKQLEEMAGE